MRVVSLCLLVTGCAQQSLGGAADPVSIPYEATYFLSSRTEAPIEACSPLEGFERSARPASSEEAMEVAGEWAAEVCHGIPPRKELPPLGDGELAVLLGHNGEVEGSSLRRLSVWVSDWGTEVRLVAGYSQEIFISDDSRFAYLRLKAEDVVEPLWVTIETSY